jgi:hypothetical protein
MNLAHTGDPVPDGVLIRWIDGELDAPDRDRLEQHLAECEHCAGRSEALRRRGARLSSLLAATAPAVPPWVPPHAEAAVFPLDAARQRRTRSPAQSRVPWMRIAAGVLLLLGLGLGASPMRAWVAHWVGERWEEATAMLGRETPAGRPDAAGSEAAAATRLRFIPEGREIMIRLASPQGGGSLLLLPHDGADVTVEVERGGAEDVLLLADAVEIRNTPTSVAVYRVRLPAALGRVEVRVGSSLQIIVPADLDPVAGLRIPLGGRQ